MSDLRSRYQKIIKELDEHITDPEEKKFIIGKFQELSMVFMDIIDRITYITDVKVKEVEDKQKEIEGKLGAMQQVVDDIESDIYEEDGSYEFEIICPYCNYEFVADISCDVNTEVECPECHNVIELDWNGEEDSCSEHSCTHCQHDCSQNEKVESSKKEIKSSKNDKKQSQNIVKDEDIEDGEDQEDM